MAGTCSPPAQQEATLQNQHPAGTRARLQRDLKVSQVGARGAPLFRSAVPAVCREEDEPGENDGREAVSPQESESRGGNGSAPTLGAKE